MTFLVALSVFILDRITKYIAISSLAKGQSIEIVRNIFNFTLILNNGTAFGLFRGRTVLFASLSILVIVFITVYVIRHKPLGMSISIALGLILGGAIGNLLDRVKFGHVIDFLDFRIWPVFNIADSAITVGTTIVLIKLLVKK